MAKTPSAATDPAAAASKGGKRKFLLLVLPVVLLAVGFFVLKPMLLPAAAEPDLSHEPGVVVELEPITLNLSDGRFLKVGLALQLTRGATEEHSVASEEGEPTPPTGKTFDGAKALDAAIAVLGARSYPQLLAPGGREKAQAALSKEVSERYESGVMKVYFTQFVMQ